MSEHQKEKTSSISHGTLVDLKAITAEHIDRFVREGKAPVKGQPRRQHLQKSKDPFDRPSPGLIKRLAAEARNDAKRRHFQDEGGPGEEERKEILKAKARKYESIKRGDYSGLTKKEWEEAVIDFEKLGESSIYSSDEDESAVPAKKRWSDDDGVEYVDEMGRTRTGTRREAKEVEDLKRKADPIELIPSGAEGSSYAEVQQSKVIHGEQHFFPVYQPDPEAIKEKYRQAEEEARAHHYDATKEVRTRGAGQYQFSLDENLRAEQQASLKNQRAETQRARTEIEQHGGQGAAQDARKRKVEERKAIIAAKRAKMLGGEKEVERLREEKRVKEADDFPKGLEEELMKKP
nr:hypothetical protein L204_05386 [Cryptococcus depauperatus CBS 7855]